MKFSRVPLVLLYMAPENRLARLGRVKVERQRQRHAELPNFVLGV